MMSEYHKAVGFWALLLLAMALSATSLPALASVQRMDADDPRIHEDRGDKFIDVFRTMKDGSVHVTVNPEIGYWSQAFGCPDGEKHIGYRALGFMIIRAPGGTYYYEVGDNSSQGEGIEAEEGDQKWYVAGLMYGNEFELICPPNKNVMSTRYLGISRANRDGLIPMPRCETDGRREQCYVLGLDLKSKLASDGWNAEHSIEGHQDLVRRFNEHILNPDDENFSREEEQASEPAEESVTEPEQSKQVDEERAQKQALAFAQRMDEDDPRIDEERGETFVRVMRTNKGDETIVTAKAPVGYWTQRLDGCPGGDIPKGVRLSGHVLFWTENPLAYYEESESPRRSAIGKILEDVLAKGNWRVTGLAESSYVILDCPRRDDAMTTEYQVIEAPNEDGLIPYPGCRIESERERCSVLDSKLVSELAENGWTTSHSVEGHSQLVDEYNKRIRDSGRGGTYIQSKMRFAIANTMLWYISYFVSIMMCIIVIRNWR